MIKKKTHKIYNYNENKKFSHKISHDYAKLFFSIYQYRARKEQQIQTIPITKIQPSSHQPKTTPSYKRKPVTQQPPKKPYILHHTTVFRGLNGHIGPRSPLRPRAHARPPTPKSELPKPPATPKTFYTPTHARRSLHFLPRRPRAGGGSEKLLRALSPATGLKAETGCMRAWIDVDVGGCAPIGRSAPPGAAAGEPPPLSRYLRPGASVKCNRTWS